MKYYIGVIILIMNISCGTASLVSDNQTNANDQVKKGLDQRSKKYKDTTLVFTCDDLSQSIEVKKINWVYFNEKIADCLLLNGFNGDDSANIQIASIIKNVKHYDLFIFGGSDAIYRGPIIFEAFLNKSQDYTPLNTFDDGEDSKYYEGTVADVYIGYYCKMIESIDGLAPYDYIGKMVNFQQTDNFEYKENGLFNPDYGVEVGTKTYNTILKAWKEGKIILKDYGIE